MARNKLVLEIPGNVLGLCRLMNAQINDCVDD
jgi:hypothetical protein